MLSHQQRKVVVSVQKDSTAPVLSMEVHRIAKKGSLMPTKASQNVMDVLRA